MNYKDWNTQEVVLKIKALGFPQYAKEFQKNEILGFHLPLISEDHLKEMGVQSVGHRIILLKRFKEIEAGTCTKLEEKSKPVDIYSHNDTYEDYQPAPKPKSSRPSSRQPTQIPKSPIRSTKPAAKIAKQEDDWDKPQPKKVQKKKSSWQDDDDTDESESSHTSSRSNKKSVPSRDYGATEQSSKKDRIDALSEESDDKTVMCQYCGRKFQPDAAKRHIPVCGRINGKNAKK